jgi:hypothetical protein
MIQNLHSNYPRKQEIYYTHKRERERERLAKRVEKSPTMTLQKEGFFFLLLKGSNFVPIRVLGFREAR